MRVTLYGLPHCTTCQKAVKWLEAEGVTVAKFVDVKTTRLTRAEIARLARLTGGAEGLFSRIAREYRKRGLHERALTEAEMLDLMVEEYTFIRRPVVVPASGGRAEAGFNEKKLRALLGL